MNTLYVKDNCPYCVIPKALIKKYNLPVRVVNVTTDSAALLHLKKLGIKTVPMLEIDDVLIRDSVEIVEILEDAPINETE